MIPPEDDIEALLARIAPAPPPAALMERLRKARPRKGRRLLRFAVPLAAAAGLALAWLGPQPDAMRHPVDGEIPARQPIGSVQHLMEVSDLGVVLDQDRRPVRLIRTRWIDEILYAPSGGGEPVKEGRLREEVLPVSLPVY